MRGMPLLQFSPPSLLGYLGASTMSPVKVSKLTVALMFSLLFLAAPAYSACSKSLVINQANWKPYMYVKENGEFAGLDYELVKAILDLAGCEYTFVRIPSKRALLELEKGRVDMVAGASITPEREVYGRFTVSYRDETMVIFIRKEQQNYYPASSLNELLNNYQLIFGAVIGAYYGAEYELLDHASLAKDNRLILMKDNERLLDLLVLNRLDAIAGDRVSLSVMARTLGIAEKVAIHEHLLNQDFVHFLLSKKSTTPQDREVLNSAIQTFVKSDEYKYILSRYGLEPYTRPGSDKVLHDFYLDQLEKAEQN
ncbi:transporter substrate-binding domain-containing protein [Hahella sp. HN01]|nr:transporter substrate-binding domain-containing protein [Hahella sp. HN01]